MKSPEFRQKIRQYEIECVFPLLPASGEVLELGAGAGWQARQLHERGYQVSAIDIGTTRYKDQQIWPVLEYDGAIIPFPDRTFDVIFSSNTLEHIPHIVSFMDEMRRVLRPDGRAVHVLPTSAWRLWTLGTHYAYLPYHLKKAYTTSVRNIRPNGATNRWEGVRRAMAPVRHGERGTALSEVQLFSASAWTALFVRAGWTVKARYPNRLFYTGNGLIGSYLPISARHRLSYVLGSACNIFVLEPSKVRA